jgi:hypothetical protein
VRLLTSPRLAIGLAVVAGFALLLSLVGLALNSEPRQDFRDRQAQGEGPGGEATGDSDGSDGDTTSGDRGSNDGRRGGSDTRLVVTPDGVEGSRIDGVLRLDDDGLLEAVDRQELTDDDTRAFVTDDGLDLGRPNGNVVVFTFDDDERLMGAEFTPDGDQLEVNRNSDGTFTFDDGTTVGPFDNPGLTDQAEQQGGLFGGQRDLPWRWVVIWLVGMTLASLALALYLHLVAEPVDLDIPALAVASTDDEFERFLAGLAGDPNPTRAIRLAFQVAEQGLGGLPRRRREETPQEWQERVQDQRRELASPVTELCGLYSRIRFGGRTADERDRQAAIAALRAIRFHRPVDPSVAQPDTGDHFRQPV